MKVTSARQFPLVRSIAHWSCAERLLSRPATWWRYGRMWQVSNRAAVALLAGVIS